MSLKVKSPSSPEGTAGLASSITMELAKQGANIVIDYIFDPKATEALEQEVAALGDQVIGVRADVSRITERQNVIHAAVNKLSHLDIMVNNAGIETRTSVLETTEGQYDEVLAINLKNAFFGTQLARQTDDQAR
jgi:glucose 1-dehydrogenase